MLHVHANLFIKSTKNVATLSLDTLIRITLSFKGVTIAAPLFKSLYQSLFCQTDEGLVVLRYLFRKLVDRRQTVRLLR